MHRGPRIGRSDEEEAQPLPPLATGIALGLWIAAMLLLAFVIVPTIFASCLGGSPPA
ncbi:MAG: hypothetical protein HYX56_07690 [Chloroflexi bacterium]|nr:hypothetical protein [Chloroflexota bacterium]